MELAEKVLNKLKKEVEEKGLKLSITEGGQGGKSKVIISCKYLEEELRECSKTKGVVMADGVGTLGVELRTQTQKLEAKKKARRKKCNVRFSIKLHQDRR